MKILQVNCVYKFGSTGKIVSDIHRELLKKGYESIVCYGRRKCPKEPGVYKVSTEIEAKIHSALSRLFGVDFGYSPFATAKLIRIIKKEKPDVVHLHCLNGHFVNVYKLVEFLKRNKIKTVLTLHAEIMHTAGCVHAMDCEKWKTECYSCSQIKGIVSRYFRDDAKHCYRLMKKAFENFENLTVVGVSDWITGRAERSPIFKDADFGTVKNGINTEIFHRRTERNLLEKHGVPEDKKVVLHVTSFYNHPMKGSDFFRKLARMLPDYQFIIVGYNGDGTDLPENVLPIAHTKDQNELAEYYSAADITLLTSKRETFSMIVAESLCCGTPVVGFKAGAPETITIPEYSEFVDYGDAEALRESICTYSEKEYDRDNISKEAKKWYSKERMAEEYIKIYNAQK